MRLPWLAHDKAPGPYITIPQYRFNKTKQHTLHQVATGTSSHVPLRHRGITITIFSHGLGINCMVPSDWDWAPNCVRGPDFRSYLIGEFPGCQDSCICDGQKQDLSDPKSKITPFHPIKLISETDTCGLERVWDSAFMQARVRLSCSSEANLYGSSHVPVPLAPRLTIPSSCRGHWQNYSTDPNVFL